MQYVQLAELEIDPLRLEEYMTAVTEQIETAIREEPGVLALYAVVDHNNPTHITIFEIYEDEISYLAHLETSHFRKYKSTVKNMVTSLKLVQTIPLILGSKAT